LPTKSNLVYRGVISSKDGLCIAGCGTLESAQHLLLSCSTFASLWPLVRDWIGLFGADSNVLSDYFVQFVYSAGGNKTRNLFFGSFGFFVPGFYGPKEIIGCSIILLLLCLGY